MSLPVNASDLAARAYGCRPRNYPVITETLGVAIVLLVNRNTTAERGLWLVHPVISDVACEAAEGFVKVLEDRPAIDGWRGGALASLRSFIPGTVHQALQQWPHGGYEGGSGEYPGLVTRIWIDDPEDSSWDRPRTMSPVRVKLAQLLAGYDRDLLDKALSALIGSYRSHLGQLAGWSNCHESPTDTRRLRGDLGAPVSARPVIT